jgi:hypothetical protein
MQYPSTNFKTMDYNDHIDDTDDNNLLGETDLDTEVEIVKKYIEMNREEHLKAITKEEITQLCTPSLKRCSTYCAPKIEERPLLTLKKEIAYDISEESKNCVMANQSAIWRNDTTDVVDPSDWIGKKALELTTNTFGVKYIIKGRNDDSDI